MKLASMALGLALMLPAAAFADLTDPMEDRIAKQQQAADRHEFDFRRDAARRPYDVFRFIGLEESISVV